MKWIKASELKNIEYRKTYFAKWPSGTVIKSTGKFQESDGTFFWNERGYIPILKKEYEMLLILDESEPLSDGQDWVSVESAPKDGTEILGYDYNTMQVYIVWWNRTMGDGCWNFAGNHYIPKISLWRPLPTPPNIENKNSK